MMQEQQGVPRLGRVGDQLVTPLPRDHSDLIGEIMVGTEGGHQRPLAQGEDLLRPAALLSGMPRQPGK